MNIVVKNWCAGERALRRKIQDVQMLVRTGGKNRTQREYREFLRARRFETFHVIPASGDLALIEARAV